MAYNETTVLGIVKARLNRLATDTSLDEYLKQRIEAADKELDGKGIHLIENDLGDMVLLADIVVWQYSNRDLPGNGRVSTNMPEWLRLARRERWLRERGKNDT